MKCRSVACVWSGSPPVQRVTATAVLNHPPTLYTGGSDGSIFWWNLSSSDSKKEIRPVAMLCGHAMPIADLAICNPIIASGDGNWDSSSDVEMNSNSDNCGALISACTDGVLCVWSRSSGHCRRRRKLPPWVGSPSIICTLPANSRYVCIACCFTDGVHLNDYDFVDAVEKSDHSLNGETHHRKPSKCTVIVVDTYTLTIVQTVFHGKLAIGALKCMTVISSSEDGGKQSVLMTDSSGNLLLVPLSKDSHTDKEECANSPESSPHGEMSIWSDCANEAGHVVSIATCRSFCALVFSNCCIFKLIGGATIGKISFLGNHLCLEGDKSHVTGGMFLESVDSRDILKPREPCKMFSESFAVWNNRGSAVVYRVSYLDDIFKFESICEIPAAPCPIDVRLSVSFVLLNHYLLRIESVYSYIEEPVQWKPRVAIWSLQEKLENGNLSQQCKMLGKGGFLVDMFAESTKLHESEGNSSFGFELASQNHSDSSSEHVNDVHPPDYKHHNFLQKGRLVTSSMVISENLYTPYATVYGFYSGDIEVVRFDVIQIIDFHGDSPCHAMESNVLRQKFLGHTGAVLCLAAHQMVNTTENENFHHVLLSGSMDCSIRIWDLHTGCLITVMHQHVAPVRQIILPPARTDRPWNDCFLSVGQDACVALSSLGTLRVERMFPGHPTYPAKVVWDSARGYIACLCHKQHGTSDTNDVLYIWDVKTGARERVLRGTASHSMFDYFCRGINLNFSETLLDRDTSISSLLLPIVEDASSHLHLSSLEKGFPATKRVSGITKPADASKAHAARESSAKMIPSTPAFPNKHPIKCSCPFPGIATLSFDLSSLMFVGKKLKAMANDDKQEKEQLTESPSPKHVPVDGGSECGTSSDNTIQEENDWIKSLEECMLQFSLSFLHLWNIDSELDRLLIAEMKLKKPEHFIVSSGLQGDKGSFTLAFPDSSANLQLWESSSEFCAMRSLTMVSLAQRMISLSQSSSSASSALAAFYTRNFSDKFPDVKPPLLQLLVSFWQGESEHVRMAARSLFHCAASRAIPLPLCGQKATGRSEFMTSIVENGEIKREVLNEGGGSTNTIGFDQTPEKKGISQSDEAKIHAWLESYEMQDWISCVGGTSQDAMTSHIIVAAALAVWYPSLVKPNLAMLVVHPLIKLVMAMNEKYTSTAAELLAEGMESTWKTCIGSEIPRLIGDIFFQVECVSGVSADSATQRPIVPATIRETLVGVLLPSLAMADVPGFLTVVESQIWSTASDSPVHLVSLMTLMRVVRGSPRSLAQYLEKAVNFILQTMDPTNSVMRRTCIRSSMIALKEVVRVFPMVALNNTSTRLAVGDAVGEMNDASIRVYDMQSVTKLKVLDATGPPGLPNLLVGTSKTATTMISALTFSLDGEGLVAFSEHGLTIRWWSLGSVWWEKLSRNYVPVQCTKLIFVPPWEGFSPTTARSSIMASVLDDDKQDEPQESGKGMNDSPKFLVRHLDLSYRLDWVGDRKILLTRHGQELGTFLL